MDKSHLPLTGSVAEKWKLDSVTEDSVLGQHFANAVMMVASGNADALVNKKKINPPCRKIFWEEPRFNASLENSNNSYAFDAHKLEESKYWKKAGKKFVGGPRFEPDRNLNGPLLPDEIIHLYEKPVPVFERSGTVNPFEKARRMNAAKYRPKTNPEKEYLELRTSLIGPSTYKLPDLWDTSAHDPLEVNGAVHSVFKSRTPRFKARKGNRLEFHHEKDGTSIPHSRGRSRGGGFKELSRPVTEGEIAAKLAASSISSWESFQEAPSVEYIPSDSKAFLDRADAALNSDIPENQFYQVSITQKPQLSSHATIGESSVRSHPSANQSSQNGSSIQQRDSSVTRRSGAGRMSIRSSTSGAGGAGGSVSSSCSPQRTVNPADNPRGGIRTADDTSTSSSAQRSPIKSRMPGFTITAKSGQALFSSSPNQSKSYQRVLLPDGTFAIVPVSAGGATGISGTSTPLQLSKTVSFNADSLSITHGRHGYVDESLHPTLQLLGNNGPQIRAMTPPRPTPPSLTQGNVYSSLRGMTPPASHVPHLQGSVPPGEAATRTRDGTALLDDESTYGSHPSQTANTTARESMGGSSYSKSIMKKWVPPVYYSSRSKTPVPEVGAIPYRQKRGSAAGLRHSHSASAYNGVVVDDALSRSIMDELIPPAQRSQHPHQGLEDALAAAASSSSSFRPKSSGGRGPIGGFNMDSGERRRHDSIGAGTLPLGETGLRVVASKGSEQVLHTVQNEKQ